MACVYVCNTEVDHHLHIFVRSVKSGREQCCGAQIGHEPAATQTFSQNAGRVAAHHKVLYPYTLDRASWIITLIESPAQGIRIQNTTWAIEQATALSQQFA
jgi:hypothetical protein